MRHKKFKLSTLLLLGLGLTGLQAQTMFVRQTINTQTAYALNNIKKMSFSSGYITISKINSSPDTFFNNGLRYLNFQDLSTVTASIETPETTISLFPNPVGDLLNIQLSEDQPKAFIIQILSLEGRVIYQKNITLQNNATQINVSSLPKGLYMCRINNGTTNQTTKFLKQ